MEGLIGALKEIGPIGIALVILLIMWVLNRQTFARHEAFVKELRAGHAQDIERRDNEIERLNKNHDAELAELKVDLAALRVEIRDLRAEMETERQARRTAEETAHQLTMRLGGAQ